MNNFCAECGHLPNTHPGCTETVSTIFGDEPCGCPLFTKDTDE